MNQNVSIDVSYMVLQESFQVTEADPENRRYPTETSTEKVSTKKRKVHVLKVVELYMYICLETCFNLKTCRNAAGNGCIR